MITALSCLCPTLQVGVVYWLKQLLNLTQKMFTSGSHYSPVWPGRGAVHLLGIRPLPVWSSISPRRLESFSGSLVTGLMAIRREGWREKDRGCVEVSKGQALSCHMSHQLCPFPTPVTFLRLAAWRLGKEVKVCSQQDNGHCVKNHWAVSAAPTKV